MEYETYREHLIDLNLTIDDLRKENQELKELCNKYEEEHNTTFKQWQKDIQKLKKIKKLIPHIIATSLIIFTVVFIIFQEKKWCESKGGEFTFGWLKENKCVIEKGGKNG